MSNEEELVFTFASDDENSCVTVTSPTRYLPRSNSQPVRTTTISNFSVRAYQPSSLQRTNSSSNVSSSSSYNEPIQRTSSSNSSSNQTFQRTNSSSNFSSLQRTNSSSNVSSSSSYNEPIQRTSSSNSSSSQPVQTTNTRTYRYGSSLLTHVEPKKYEPYPTPHVKSFDTTIQPSEQLQDSVLLQRIKEKLNGSSMIRTCPFCEESVNLFFIQSHVRNCLRVVDQSNNPCLVKESVQELIQQESKVEKQFPFNNGPNYFNLSDAAITKKQATQIEKEQKQEEACILVTKGKCSRNKLVPKDRVIIWLGDGEITFGLCGVQHLKGSAQDSASKPLELEYANADMDIDQLAKGSCNNCSQTMPITIRLGSVFCKFERPALQFCSLACFFGFTKTLTVSKWSEYYITSKNATPTKKK